MRLTIFLATVLLLIGSAKTGLSKDNNESKNKPRLYFTIAIDPDFFEEKLQIKLNGITVMDNIYRDARLILSDDGLVMFAEPLCNISLMYEGENNIVLTPYSEYDHSFRYKKRLGKFVRVKVRYNGKTYRFRLDRRNRDYVMRFKDNKVVMEFFHNPPYDMGY